MESSRFHRQDITEVTSPDVFSGRTLEPLAPVHPLDIPNYRERRRARTAERKARPHKIARKLAAVAICASTITSISYNAFMYDQNTLADEVWGTSKAHVDVLYSNYDSPTEPTTYIYVLPNTGVRDAHQIANPLRKTFDAIPNAQLMSLTEGTHPQINDTFEAIDSTINPSIPPDHFVFYGTSVGGKEALSIADHVREKLPKSDITIVLSSSPYDQNSAYALQGEGNRLPLLADIADEMNLHGGPVTRILGEFSIQVGDYCFDENGTFDFESCQRRLKDTIHENVAPTTSTNDLLEWQVQWTRVNSAGQDMAKLRNVKNGPRTDILYINTTQDIIVDENEAIPKYAKDAIKNDIPFTVTPIDVPHSTEHMFPEKYSKEVLLKYFAKINDIYDSVDVKLESDPRETKLPHSGAKPYTPI